MKKIIAVLLALTMMSLICGCGNEETAKPSKKVPESSSEENSVTSSDTASEEVSYEEKVSAVGEPVSQDTVYDLDFNTADIDSVEYGTSTPTLKTKWDNSGMVKSGNSDAQATALRNKILSAKNTAQIYKITGTTYYVSPKGNDSNDGKSPAI